jgi:hypothetical protein
MREGNETAAGELRQSDGLLSLSLSSKGGEGKGAALRRLRSTLQNSILILASLHHSTTPPLHYSITPLLLPSLSQPSTLPTINFQLPRPTTPPLHYSITPFLGGYRPSGLPG